MTSPFPVHTVVGKKEISGVCKSVIVTEHVYRDVVYDYVEKELKGFRFV